MITLDDVSEEFVVGGVFLRLFISQPNWVSFSYYFVSKSALYITHANILYYFV